MKRPVRFHCAIAGTFVMIQPRTGQNLGESGQPYVRCSERDCQYVDLNQAPCPLRAGMFDDTDAHRLAAYLASARRPICYACLGEKLDLTHDIVRRIAFRLTREAGAAIGPGRCVVCASRRVTIRVPRGPVNDLPSDASPVPRCASVDEPDIPGQCARVEVALPTAPEASCATCVALRVGLPLIDVRQAIDTLVSSGKVAVSVSMCTTCCRVLAVARSTRRVRAEDVASRHQS